MDILRRVGGYTRYDNSGSNATDSEQLGSEETTSGKTWRPSATRAAGARKNVNKGK